MAMARHRPRTGLAATREQGIRRHAPPLREVVPREEFRQAAVRVAAALRKAAGRQAVALPAATRKPVARPALAARQGTRGRVFRPCAATRLDDAVLRGAERGGRCRSTIAGGTEGHNGVTRTAAHRRRAHEGPAIGRGDAARRPVVAAPAASTRSRSGSAGTGQESRGRMKARCASGSTTGIAPRSSERAGAPCATWRRGRAPN
mmetsp:Transcript_56095/g.156284  ORF Transcript_56095/g.156284 Transcript_56095/m.156284 type:complete len:204 (+) Transcript_56095:232-843(+)